MQKVFAVFCLRKIVMTFILINVATNKMRMWNVKVVDFECFLENSERSLRVYIYTQ